MDNNYFCKCGHKQEKHLNVSEACYGCLEDYIRGTLKHFCISFKLDNLEYLEQRYNEKNLEQYKETKEI